MLLLDAGDSLFGYERPAKISRGASTIEAMNLLGYDALSLGSSDLRLGVEVLRARQSEADFPFLSANVVISGTDELLAEPFVLKELNGLHLGIIGLTDVWDLGLRDVQIRDPYQAVQEYDPTVRARSDLVIVLSHAGRPVDERIAAEVSGVDFIVSGGPQGFTWQPLVDERTGTVIVQADHAIDGEAGRHIGLLTLVCDSEGRVLDYTWRMQGLGPEVPDDPELALFVDKWTTIEEDVQPLAGGS